jgi:hypothetical protein
MDRTPTTLQTIRGTDLVDNAPTIQWQELVAVILQLADTIEHLGVMCVPDLAHMQLCADGTIVVLPGSTWSDPPATYLARRLRSLLQDPTTPPELVRMIAQVAEPTSSDQSVEGFVASLRGFERPGRQAVLHDLVERIATYSDPARRAQELERLIAQARSATATPWTGNEPSNGPRPQKPQGQRPLPVAITTGLVAIVLLGVTVTVWWSALAGSTGGAKSSATQVRPGISQAADRSFAPPGGDRSSTQMDSALALPAPVAQNSAPPRPVPAAHTSPTAQPAPAANAGTREFKADSAGSGAGRVRRGSAPPNLPPPSTVIASSSPGTLRSSERPATMADPAPESERIYSRLDPDATPPVALPPALGRITTDAHAMPGDMDILVGPTGDVERVTLVVPDRYEGHMLIYAMKNRKFRPAIVDGRPVRYLVRVRTAN